MGCLSKGLLRAYLDGELDAAEREAVERHMTRCRRCERAARLDATAQATRSRLDLLAPVAAPDLERAIVRSRELRQGPRTLRERSMSVGSRISRRPALAVGLVVLLLAGLLSFGPGRALARQVLSVFRVRRFAVVQLNGDVNRLQEVVEQLEDDLFVSDEPTVIREPTHTSVDTIEEAGALVGFDARIPAYWPDGGTPRITVEGPSEHALLFRGDGLRLLLELAEMDPAAIPAELVEGEVRIASGGAVCLKGGSASVTQIADVTATYPDGIDVAVIIEAGLRVLGMDPQEAQRISREYDWSSTALVPVLSDATEVRETEIAGASALLVRFRESSVNRATLLMEKDGVLYLITGSGKSGSFQRLAQVAESMF